MSGAAPDDRRGPDALPLDRTGVRLQRRGVGSNNPSMPWSELERRLSGGAAPGRRRGPRWAPTAATARPGPASGPYEPPPAPGRRRPSRTPSCTATRTSVPRRRLPPRGARRGGGPARPRGAGGHRPRRLLRRRPVRRGGASGRAADGLRRRAHPRRARQPPNGVADPRASTSSSSPAIRRATPGWPVRSPPSWPGRRARRASTSTSWPSCPAATGGAHRLPQGRGAGRPRAAARPPPSGRSTAGRRVRP